MASIDQRVDWNAFLQTCRLCLIDHGNEGEPTKASLVFDHAGDCFSVRSVLAPRSDDPGVSNQTTKPADRDPSGSHVRKKGFYLYQDRFRSTNRPPPPL